MVIIFTLDGVKLLLGLGVHTAQLCFIFVKGCTDKKKRLGTTGQLRLAAVYY